MTDTPPLGVAAADPSELPLDELRAQRRQLQLDDDAVSYARRIAQARLDLVAAEIGHRAAPHDAAAGAPSPDVDDELRDVLSAHLTGGPARPPRPTDDLSDHPLAVELDDLCARHGLGRMRSLEDAQLVVLTDVIGEFEAKVSADRRARYDRLDALSAELVRRYRNGEADIDSLPS